MKKVILASLLATMMSTSPVWATDSATAAPAAAATTQVQKEAADVLQTTPPRCWPPMMPAGRSL